MVCQKCALLIHLNLKSTSGFMNSWRNISSNYKILRTTSLRQTWTQSKLSGRQEGNVVCIMSLFHWVCCTLWLNLTVKPVRFLDDSCEVSCLDLKNISAVVFEFWCFRDLKLNVARFSFVCIPCRLLTNAVMTAVRLIRVLMIGCREWSNSCGDGWTPWDLKKIMSITFWTKKMWRRQCRSSTQC